MSANRILIVGLGNLPLPRTRHSVGHYVVDSLAARLGLGLSKDKSPADGYFGQTTVDINEQPVVLSLFKPTALMNVTGRPVSVVCRQTVPSSASMIVIHDSLDDRSGALKYKFGGSANGHRGIRSVISAVQGEFHRFRIGIGRGGDVKEYVLGPLDSYEKEFWGENGGGIDLVWQNIEKVHHKLSNRPKTKPS